MFPQLQSLGLDPGLLLTVGGGGGGGLLGQNDGWRWIPKYCEQIPDLLCGGLQLLSFMADFL